MRFCFNKSYSYQRICELLKCDPNWGPRNPQIDYKYRRHGNSSGDEKLQMLTAKSDDSHDNRCCLKPGENSSFNSPTLHCKM